MFHENMKTGQTWLHYLIAEVTREQSVHFTAYVMQSRDQQKPGWERIKTLTVNKSLIKIIINYA